MGQYLIVMDNNGCSYTVEALTDKVEALRRCKQYNREVGNGARYFVIRTTDGQTWEYVYGGIYSIVVNQELGEIEYKPIAI